MNVQSGLIQKINCSALAQATTLAKPDCPIVFDRTEQPELNPLTCAVFVVFLFATAPAAAATATDDVVDDAPEHAPPDWTITVDPLTAALGYPHLQFERRISDDFTAYAGPHMRLYDSVFEDETEPYRGYGAEFGVRWFVFGGAPAGFWLSARTVAAHLTTHAPAEPSSDFGGYTSALAGYTYFLKDWFVLSGGAGVQYLYYDIDDFGTRTLFPAMHTTFGVAF